MLTLTFPQPLAGLLGNCEVHCVAGCCGADAFDFAPQYLTDAVRVLGAEQVAAALDQLEGLYGQAAGRSGAVHTNVDLYFGKTRELFDFLEPFRAVALEALYNVFGRALFDPLWLSADGDRVLGLVRTIQRKKDFAALPVLADALEEAGCQAPLLLRHCRAPGHNAEMCWLAELLLHGSARPFTADAPASPQRPGRGGHTGRHWNMRRANRRRG
jgi:hypothetical protein